MNLKKQFDWENTPVQLQNEWKSIYDSVWNTLEQFRKDDSETRVVTELNGNQERARNLIETVESKIQSIIDFYK